MQLRLIDDEGEMLGFGIDNEDAQFQQQELVENQIKQEV